MKTILKFGGILFLTLISTFILFLLIMTISEFNPKEKTKLEVYGTGKNIIGKKFTILTWNIGYSALGKEADFFMDGGKQSIGESKEVVEKHIKNITKNIIKEKSDFIFLQEIDKNSTRSYHVNEYNYVKDNLKNYTTTFATNYKTLWVPIPLFKPMGKVLSGISLFSKYKPDSSIRYSFPGSYSWPTKLFQLDRCFIETRYKIGNKNLIMINLHLSAFDKGGFLRKKQVSYLKEHILEEYNNGDFIVVGGDWNSIFPNTNLDKINITTEKANWNPVKINKDFMPKDWKFVADNNIATCRENNKIYKRGRNHLYIIDGFLLSPNVSVDKINGIDLDFQDSDHNPVYMEFSLKM
ncbi:endonuclease/exonuclease/phosphatase family protein [Haliovirga abyssi]|uniref:Endonuclease n=1 Tax=Haliovirga abyssi TaxID=2996794 RepID=A0AAU9DC07_9FUSO|nr:endonuclease/exonuclease/phosphatase family protein [Haliovirga abyssi]BDU49817.1 endonuclease [Haliovirga abyssi]